MTALQARGLTVQFGRGHRRLTAVDRVDLDVLVLGDDRA